MWNIIKLIFRFLGLGMLKLLVKCFNLIPIFIKEGIIDPIETLSSEDDELKWQVTQLATNKWNQLGYFGFGTLAAWIGVIQASAGATVIGWSKVIEKINPSIAEKMAGLSTSILLFRKINIYGTLLNVINILITIILIVIGVELKVLAIDIIVNISMYSLIQEIRKSIEKQIDITLSQTTRVICVNAQIKDKSNAGLVSGLGLVAVIAVTSLYGEIAIYVYAYSWAAMLIAGVINCLIINRFISQEWLIKCQASHNLASKKAGIIKKRRRVRKD